MNSKPLSLLLLSLAYPASAAIHYVDANSAAPTPPFTNWATAATTIQDAVNAAASYDTVLVTNGVYATGGRNFYMSNRVACLVPITLQSVNGPENTIILGAKAASGGNGPGAVRCVFMPSGQGLLSGFTLSNGATVLQGDEYHACSGGGICASTGVTVTNCVLRGNSAADFGGGAYNVSLYNCTLVENSAAGGLGLGGGAYGGSLENCQLLQNRAKGGGGAQNSILVSCLLSGNAAVGGGGGACMSTLYNCTVVANQASTGGGVDDSTLGNCIVYFNSSTNDATANFHAGTFDHTCTFPLPPAGVDNFTNEPLLMDLANSDFRLQSNSPCVNAGRNAKVFTATDLDGNPRIAGGTVDLGAYEFQNPLSALSYAWLQRFGLPVDGTADTVDSDGDGMNNLQEWLADTDPTNPASALRLVITMTDPPATILSWQSSTNRTYALQRSLASTNSGDTPFFVSLASKIPGGPGTTVFTDTNSTSCAGPVLYRLLVGSP